jgi:Na+/proline symporter
MYLMALGNIDYIVITVLFAIICIIAYSFRHKNQTASLFIYADSDKPCAANQFLIGYGVIELALCGAIGAIYGVSGIYYIGLAVFLSGFLSLYITKIIYPRSLLEYIGFVLGAKTQAVFATFCIIVLLFLTITTTVFTFKLFQPILGWNFVNSVFGITGLTLIYMLTGGCRAVKSNLMLSAAMVLFGFLLVVGLGIFSLGGFSGVIDGLHDLAHKKNMVDGSYTEFNIDFPILYQIIIMGLFLIMTSFLVETKSGNQRINFVTLFKIIPLGLMMLSGVIAISTPIDKVGSSQIVTIQAQLPDGQTGYVVKAINNDSSKAKPSEVMLGILPPTLDPKTNLIQSNSYNYMLAGMVAFRHYLPKTLSVLLVLVILSAFIFAMSGYLLGISKLVVFDVYAKLGWWAHYGEDGKIWLTRMSLIFAGGISLFGGYFLMTYLDLARAAYIMGGLALIFCVFVLFLVTYYGRQTQKK